MLRLLSRRRSPSPLPVAAPRAAATNASPDSVAGAERHAAGACALSSCIAGARATVLAVGCGDVEACRLRALGLCEGASVSVVGSRDCTLLEVRGARLAVGHTIASGITVLPVS
ncbi:MAG TPA: FeoA family protein [Gemmatimonadales bacterium]